MRHLITNIDTFIKDRNLFVSIYIDSDWYPFAETGLDKLPQNVRTLSIFELDFLEGCYLEPSSFYKRGEKMRDGKIIYEEENFPKTWKIALEGNLDELKERNKSKLLPFQSIYDIEISEKNNKLPYVRVRTTDNNVYFTKLHLFKGLVGINEDEFYLLKGVFISPVMYKKGDIGQYGGKFTTITQDDKIVASFNIRIEGTLDDHFKLYGNPTMKNIQANNRNNFREEDDSRYSPSYEKYNGYNGWNDDTIDIAFEGDPGATWNVD